MAGVRRFSAEEIRLRRNAQAARYRRDNWDKYTIARKAHNERNKDRIRARRREWYLENKALFAAYSLKYKDANHAALLFRAARLRARKSGIPFEIELSDVVIPEFCPALGLKLIRNRGVRSPASATLDRIDNSRGYEKGNIQVICYRANAMKNDATFEEVEKLYLFLKAQMIALGSDA